MEESCGIANQKIKGLSGGVNGVDRAGKIFRENAKINIIIIPNHQTGMLLLKTAKIEFALSNFDSARLAKKYT